MGRRAAPLLFALAALAVASGGADESGEPLERCGTPRPPSNPRTVEISGAVNAESAPDPHADPRFPASAVPRQVAGARKDIYSSSVALGAWKLRSYEDCAPVTVFGVEMLLIPPHPMLLHLRRLVNAASAARGGVAAALFSQQTFDASKATPPPSSC
jgi:hypothetical protein